MNVPKIKDLISGGDPEYLEVLARQLIRAGFGLSEAPKASGIVSIGELRNCPDCNVNPGEPHEDGCDVELCSSCKGQRLMCECEDHDPEHSRWTGVWPGKLECREKGWYSILVPGRGWRPCGAEIEGSSEDLNRWSYFAQVGKDDYYVRMEF